MFEKKEIAIRMKRAREALPGNVSPTHFAKQAKNVDGSQYTKYEKGGALGSKKIMELCSRWNINPEWLYTGKGEMFLTGMEEEVPVESERPNATDYQSEKLAQALADQARANRDQAEGYKTLAEAYKEMLELVRDMRKEMARELTQAKIDQTTGRIEVNLGSVVQDVTTLVERQFSAIEEIRDQFSQLKADKKHPSKDVRKKGDQNGNSD